MRLIPVALAGAILAAGCASDITETNYQAELRELRADCNARGGVLQSISSSQSAHPQTDYACRLQDVNADSR